MPQQSSTPPRVPAVGEDVTALMPAVGADVTALMGQGKPKTFEEQMPQLAKDMGIGAVKSTGRNILDLTKLAATVNPANVLIMAAGVPDQYRMGYTPPQWDDLLAENNRAQKVGGRTADVLSMVIPAGMALRGARAASAASKAAPAMARAGPAAMTPEGIADYLATLGKPTTTTAAPAATAATQGMVSPTARKVLIQGMLDATKYGAGGAVANTIRRLLIGGQ